jgi:hypothetical protein
MGWGVDFHSDALRARATLVEAQVRRGGCDGSTLFSTRISAAEAGDNPTELAPGRYGFYARARDANCVWFATGCTEARLPSDTTLTVVLQEVPGVNRDPSCVPGEHNEDAVTADEAGHGDGGITTLPSHEDASTPDAPGEDAGAEPPPPDASVDAGDQATSEQCADLTADVVACYDFDGSLEDRSQRSNHAQGQGVTYESLGDDRALRVAGNTVSVAHDATLDLSVLTVELWLRVDSLVNLASETDEMSIVLDKDKQYLVGFGSKGAPTFQL